jgi:threonine synthase
LQVASVLDGQQVVEGTLLSNGSGRMVSDEEIYYWQARLIREEGIYAEPAGAVALAGLAKAEEAGVILPTSCVVCLVTGSGFKDRKSIEQMLGSKSLPLIEAGEI